MNETQLEEFSARYTAAWRSQNAPRVAAFFAEHGSLTINNGVPEEWTFGPDGLVAESKGHFDEADYQRQLKA